jgi:SAM-dependent methyltransferase
MIARPTESGTTTDFEFNALREAENYRRALWKMFAPHLRGRVIEVGAGIGQFTALLRESKQMEYLLAIEPDPRFCAEFRRTMPDQPLFEGSFSSLGNSGPWNGIVSVNVLEHIRDDEAELGLYAKALGKSRGRLCLYVPARQEIYAPIEIDFGHYRRYSKRGLRKKLKRAGFTILELHYFNFIGYFAWWFNFRIRGQRTFDQKLLRLFDRAIFPVGFALESYLGWPPIGQSLVAIAEVQAA